MLLICIYIFFVSGLFSGWQTAGVVVDMPKSIVRQKHLCASVEAIDLQ